MVIDLVGWGIATDRVNLDFNKTSDSLSVARMEKYVL